MSSPPVDTTTSPDVLRLLSVGDDRGPADAAASILEAEGTRVSVDAVGDAAAALEYLRDRTVDCVVAGPGGASTDEGLLAALGASGAPTGPGRLPVVLLVDGAEAAAGAVEAGATDCVRTDHDVWPSLLAARIRTVTDRHRLDRLNALVGGVSYELVRAADRPAIERAVCERLTRLEGYRLAWVGETDVTTRTVTPRAVAGVGEDYLEAVDVTVDGDEPAGRSLETGTAQVVADVTTYEDPEMRAAATARGFRSAAAVPLLYDTTTYGVLSVYADRYDAFAPAERAALEELGRTVGHAINAAERRKALITDSIVELELSVTDERLFFVDASAETDAAFTLEGVISAVDSYLEYYTVEGVDPEHVLDLAAASPSVERARLVNAYDDGCLFEFRSAPPSVVTTLADHGATVRSVAATGGKATVVAELPTDADVRTVVDAFCRTFDGATLLAQHDVERSIQTRRAFRDRLERRFTDRQRAALEAAYHAGFFEWPRESTGEEVADSLGVAAPTFHKHLRVGERKLLEVLLGDATDV